MKTPLNAHGFIAIYSHILSNPDQSQVSTVESDEGWFIFLSGDTGPHVVLMWADSKLTNLLDAK